MLDVTKHNSNCIFRLSQEAHESRTAAVVSDSEIVARISDSRSLTFNRLQGPLVAAEDTAMVANTLFQDCHA